MSPLGRQRAFLQFRDYAALEPIADPVIPQPIPLLTAIGPSVMDSLTPLERYRYLITQVSNKQRIDNMFYQYEQGFLDKEMYEEYIVSAIQGFAPIWKELGLTTGRTAFNKEIEKVLNE